MAQSGGKRKRADDERVRPSKKVAIEASKLVENVVVSVVTDSDKWTPIVGENLHQILESLTLSKSLLPEVLVLVRQKRINRA
jgi:hypothetical protein